MSSTVKIKGSCYIYFRYCGFVSLACSFICSVLSYLRTLGIRTLGEIRENDSRILPKLLLYAITNGIIFWHLDDMQKVRIFKPDFSII